MRNKWNRASAVLEFGQDELNQLIAPAFPDSCVTDWRHSDGGLANTNIFLRLNDRSQPILLRLFVRDPEQAPKEWAINRLVHSRVPSPEFFYFSAENPFTAHPYILMEWIDAVRMETVVSGMDTNEIEELGRSVGFALAAVHSHKFERAGFLDSELNVGAAINLGGFGLIAYAEDCLVAGVGGERLGAPLTRRLFEFLESEGCLLDDWHGQPCLTHSDFGGSNILVKKTSEGWTVVAVLDWEFAFSGTPFFDFGNLLRAPHGTTPGFAEAVLDGYQLTGAQLPATWRRMSLLTDLTAWMEFLTREDPGESLIKDARRVISQTIESW